MQPTSDRVRLNIFSLAAAVRISTQNGLKLYVMNDISINQQCVNLFRKDLHVTCK